ncbi:protein PTCD3 homolog, mitochondrial [Anoplophora glabripennis]|uniref:protein PTCD3 homolog, mitochondrial n=1 Tax=Anoplophora glabripennis TaxID=217634 RepID=UPI000875821E|nr:protein PTCD3 homolog, mitochondrial [Anoplophora glabripennis]
MSNISTVLLKRLKNLKQANYVSSLLCRNFSQSAEVDEKIEIPKRIPRGPTDILRALESTISRDPTAAHYKYHDDPYLIPMSNVGKRTFAMAQEAGRKAAHWIRQEHADVFNHREADPVIKAFLPRVVYNENSEVTEDDLKQVIEDVQVADAYFVYKLLKSKGVEISKKTEQDLLELLCYFNSENTLSEEFIEERWFKQSSRSKERQRKTWKDGSLAEEVFISIENPTGETYSAIIQGMSKHFQVDRAHQLFEEAQEKGIVLSTNTYNCLIRVVNFLKESYDLRWNLVVELLSGMNNAGLRPNLGTLNAVLQALSTMGGGKIAKDNALKTLREFKDLGIEPSLASYYYVLITFCKERGPKSTILYDIMTQVENKQHKIRDLNDTNFFISAMDVCRNHLNDIELAKRIDKLLHFGNNYDLIGDSYKESIYYRHYFILLVTYLPLEEFMLEVYEKLVPNIYVPEPSVMGEVLKQVDLNGAVEYVPKLWSDMTVFDHTGRENLVGMMLNIMVNNGPAPNPELKERFSYVAWEIYNKIEGQDENKFNKIIWTGELLGKIMTLVLQNNEFSKACQVMEKLDKGHGSIVGVPKFEDLSLFVDKCIEDKAPSRAITCIQYCADNGFPDAKALAAKLDEKLTLTEEHLKDLSKIVGNSELASKSSVAVD